MPEGKKVRIRVRTVNCIYVGDFLIPPMRNRVSDAINEEQDRKARDKAGEAGGQVVFCGPPVALRQADTATGRFLAGRGGAGAGGARRRRTTAA